MTWLGTWAKRRKVTVDNTNIDSDLTHFPVPIVLGTSVGQSSQDVSDIFDELGSSPLKIAITKADGITQIYGEVELWDDTNEKAVIWVSKSDLVLSSTGTTDLYIYFDSIQMDNTTFIGSTTSTQSQNVWDTDFVGVYHMAQDPNGDVADSIKDSTSNANNGTPAGSMTTTDLIDGLFGKAIATDGVDDLIDLQDITGMDGATRATFEFAGKIKAFVADGALVRKWMAGQQAFSLGLFDNTPYNDLMMLINDATPANLLNIRSTNAALVADTDYVLSMAWDGTNVGRAYKDGTALTTSITNDNNQVSIADVTEHCAISARYNAGTPDKFASLETREIRLSKINRSAAWLKATGYALKDNLLTFTSAETFSLVIPTAEMTMDASISGVLQSVPVPTAEITMVVSIGAPIVVVAVAVPTAQMTMAASINDPIILTTVFMIPAQMTMAAKVGVVEIVQMEPAEMTMNAGITGTLVQILMAPAEMTMIAGIEDIAQFSHTFSDVYYIFTLTGVEDGVSDIEMPITSFQTRMRNGDPTFLSVVIPSGDLASDVTARPNGTLKIDMAYKKNGEFLQRETIVQAELESVRVDEGATSSIILTGHKTEFFTGSALTLDNSLYRNTIDGKIRHRLAQPNIYLRPGDTVSIGSDTFVVGLITYFISVKSKTMEISEA